MTFGAGLTGARGPAKARLSTTNTYPSPPIGCLLTPKHRQLPGRRHRIEIDNSIGNRRSYRFWQLRGAPAAVSTPDPVAIAAFTTPFHLLSVWLDEVVGEFENLAI